MEENFGYYKKYIPDPMSQRSPFLSGLCLLSFIGSSILILTSMIILIFYDSYFMFMKYQTLQENPDPIFQMLIALTKTFFLLMLFISTTTFYGAFEMWRMKRRGFYYYTGASLLQIIISFIYMDAFAILLITFINIIFITMYAVNLKNIPKSDNY